VDETLDILKMVPDWQIVHVKMEVNTTAYGLVKTKIKHVIDQVWMKNIPLLL
jgi:hypothetical protein